MVPFRWDSPAEVWSPLTGSGRMGRGPAMIFYWSRAMLWQKGDGGSGRDPSSGGVSLAVLELGDLYRLYLERTRYSTELFVQRKQEIMAEMDAFLEKLSGGLAKTGGVLWIVSPEANAEALKVKSLLTPVLRWEAGTGPAMLSSATTRRPGVVAAVDLAPSLLKEFGAAKPPAMVGRRWPLSV
ncbi:hypothetical protein LJK88_03365 [Paenibacillus sp. P26]|nr:hypothetical protein LJK88_03365 [Paenibacillus sp. P26]